MKDSIKERIDMIVAMMIAITDMPQGQAIELIKNTVVYQNIIAREECTLYEDYNANLLEIVEEIKATKHAEWVEKITEDAVSKLNVWLFRNNIQNAEQFRKCNYGKALPQRRLHLTCARGQLAKEIKVTKPAKATGTATVGKSMSRRIKGVKENTGYAASRRPSKKKSGL